MDRTLTLGLTATNNAILSAPTTATVTILDNDSILNFSAATYSVVESGGSVTIAVNRLGGSADAYSVRFATADLTAVAGVNYTATNGTLTWLNGDVTAKTFNVPVLHSLLTNGNLTVNLSLFNATNLTVGSSVTLSGQTNAVLTIIDAESAPGQLGFSSAAYSVMESSNSVTITINRVGGLVGALTVTNTPADGTATNGIHYVATTNTFTFAAGQTATNFTVQINDTPGTNVDRTFTLALTATNNAILSAPTTATVTILDNDSIL
ncbi:MAG: hypothetical protein EBY09_14120, partial [Verrucomicrobia bacterium]|nr:hypothetical protein [Verrucomicrobiota bacterium]